MGGQQERRNGGTGRLARVYAAAMVMRRWMAVAILLLGPVAVMWPTFPLWGASALEDDLIYYLPQRMLTGEILANGQMPWWNPWVGMGYPLMADPQAAVLYPGTWLFAALGAWLAYPLHICLHFSLAGLGVYLLCRRCGMVRPAALLGGLVFMFSGFLVGHRVHLTMHASAAWLGWILLCLDGVVRVRPGVISRVGQLQVRGWGSRLGWSAGLGFAVSMQFLAGHVQVTVMTAAIAALWIAFFTRGWWRAMVGLLVAAGLAGLTVAPQLWASLHLAGQSPRGSPGFAAMAENSFLPPFAVMWVLPMFYGVRTPNFYSQSWWGYGHFCELSCYVGLLPLVLGLWGVWQFGRRDRMVLWCAVLAGLGLAMALGEYSPVYWLVWWMASQVPGLGSLRCPARWIFAVNFAQALLAARVLHLYFASGDPRVEASLARGWKWAGLGVLGGCAVLVLGTGAFLAWGLPDWARTEADRMLGEWVRAIRPANPAIWVAFLAMVATATILLTSLRRSADATRWRALTVVVFLDLAMVAGFVDVAPGPWRVTPVPPDAPLSARIRSAAAFFESDLADRIRRHGQTVVQAAGQGEVPVRYLTITRGGFADPLAVLLPSVNVFHRLSSVQTYGPLPREADRRLFNTQPWLAAQAPELLASRVDLASLLDVQALVLHDPGVRALRHLLDGGIPTVDAGAWSGGQRLAWNRPEPLQTTLGPVEPAASSTPANAIDRLADWRIVLVQAGLDRGQRAGQIRLRFAWGGAEPVWFALHRSEVERGIRRMLPLPGGGEPVDVRIFPVDAATATLSLSLQPVQVHREPLAGMPRVEEQVVGGIGLDLLSRTAGRVFVAGEAFRVADALDAADVLAGVAEHSGAATRWDGFAVAYPGGQGEAGGDVRMVRYAAHEVVVEVGPDAQQRRERLVVLNDGWDSGWWRVEVDGRPAQAVCVNALVRGVWVGPEAGVVRWVCDGPLAVQVRGLMWAWLGGLLLTAAIGWAGWWRWRVRAAG